MITSAASVENGSRLDADLVIIGGGAAGITIANRLIGKPVRVILLEAGGTSFDASSQDFYKGAIAGQPTDAIDISRLRFFGGTTNHWAGWCRPLEESDFKSRPDWPESGWAVTRAELAPFYEEATRLCQLGPLAFDDPKYWQHQRGGERLVPFSFNPALLQSSIFQISPPTKFGKTYGPALGSAKNITVMLDAAVLELLPAPASNRESARKTVGSVQVKTKGGKTFSVSGRAFIVALGGIESARLLLLSDKIHSAGAGNENDLVGRYFMDHPWMTDAAFVRFPNTGIEAPLYFDRTRVAGATVFGVVTPSADLLQREHIAGFRLVLTPTRVSTAGADSAREVAQQLRHGTFPDHLGDHLGNMLSDINVLADSAYKTITGSKQGLLSNAGSGPYKGAFIDLNFEQRPNRDSRVSLDATRDSNGQRRVRLDWRFSDTDRRTATRALDIAAHEFGRIGIGRVRTRLDVAHGGAWPTEVTGSNHHSGTARMSDSSKTGVVDRQCRVHTMENLYVAGSAVFPTTGYANPTLTIVALASRLASHMERVLS